MDYGFVVGEKVFVRTVTMYYVGEVAKVHAKEIVLKSASWVADTGNFGQALRDGTFSEIEKYVDDCHVALGGLIDWTPWKHDLP
jgi:hypothetical protein